MKRHIIARDFDPRMLPNLQLWLDARWVNGLGQANPTTETAVQTWKDLSGKGRDATQAIAASRPLFIKTKKNIITTYERSINAATWSNNGVSFTGTTTSPGSFSDASVHTYLNDVSRFVQEGEGVPKRYAVPPSTSATFSVWLRSDASRPLRLSAETDGGTWSGQVGYNLVAVTTTWTRFSITLTNTHSTNTQTFKVLLYNFVGDGSTTTRVEIWHPQVEFGSTATAWQPAFAMPNNNPALLSDGIDDRLFTVSFTAGPNVTIYSVIFLQLNNASFGRVYNYGVDGNLIMYGRSGTTANGHVRVDEGSTAGTGMNQFNTVTGGWPQAWKVFSHRVQRASSMTFHMNGTSLASLSLNATPSITDHDGAFAVASASGAANFTAAAFGCFLLYSDFHTPETRQKIERWLGRTWGIPVA